MKTICLNMIVKNENHVIRRCLESVKPIIDYWVIFDTGSTDGTETIIREVLREIPGELHQSPWVNFEHNRNEALIAARGKGDYLFFFDADEILVIEKPFDRASWDKDFYMMKAKGDNSDFFHPNFVKNDSGWRWIGVLHECIINTKKMAGEILEEAYVKRPQDGARSLDPDKLAKDLAILQEASKKEPWNARHVFYIAQTHSAMQDFPQALKFYEKRSFLDGDQDELFWTFFRIGFLQDQLGKPKDSIIANLCKAHQLNPYRAEPLERLANFYNQNKLPSLAYMIGKVGITMRMPNALNSDFYPWVYEFGLLLQLADASYLLSLWDEAEEHYRSALTKPTLPPHLQQHIHKQLRLIKQKQKEKISFIEELE